MPYATVTVCAAAIFAGGLALSAQTPVTLTVAAHMDIYRAGGYNDGSDGDAPVALTFTAGSGQTITFPSVTGSWTCSGEVPPYGPDGTASGACNNIGFQFIENPIGPFAGYALTDFVGALAGVFLEDSLPLSAPSPLRFYASDDSKGGFPISFRALTPKIGQVFFIGDGLTGTGSGSPQIFSVPPTATHLYLGYVDWCGTSEPYPGCYHDNAGSLTARVILERIAWSEPNLSVSPSGRCCMGMTYDPHSGSTLMFGGFTNPAFLDDTWIWNGAWTQLTPANAPSARQGPGMSYDAAGGNVVLFGGTDASGTFLNDTWTWDGITWTRQFPAVSPPPRRFDTQGLAYDAATKTVLMFGGLSSGTTEAGDTWTWNGVTKEWTQFFPATSPSPRRATIAYDPLTATVLLFGGQTQTSSYNDTWLWNGVTWTQKFPTTAPSARGMQSMVFDDAISSIVLFGGSNLPGTQSNQTWLWNGSQWYELAPPVNPAARWAAGIAYDLTNRYAILFGGFGTTTLDDTWLLTWVP